MALDRALRRSFLAAAVRRESRPGLRVFLPIRLDVSFNFCRCSQLLILIALFYGNLGRFLESWKTTSPDFKLRYMRGCIEAYMLAFRQPGRSALFPAILYVANPALNRPRRDQSSLPGF